MLVTTHDAGAAAAAHITTLEWDYPAMGELAADVLLDLVDGGSRSRHAKSRCPAASCRAPPRALNHTRRSSPGGQVSRHREPIPPSSDGDEAGRRSGTGAGVRCRDERCSVGPRRALRCSLRHHPCSRRPRRLPPGASPSRRTPTSTSCGGRPSARRRRSAVGPERMGRSAWLDQQLNPASIDDAVCAGA